MAKILLIEDDQLLSSMYAQKLKNDGYQVVTAVDGVKGLQLAKQNIPTIILLDIMMPKKNGLQVLEELKKDPDKQINSIPVILLTNLARNDADISKGLELGAVTYLVKSKVKPSDVVAKIKEILKASKKS